MSKQLWEKQLLGLNALPLSVEEPSSVLLLERKITFHILCLHVSHFAMERERRVVSGR